MENLESPFKDFALQKRTKLFERITLFGAAMGLFHFFPDLINGTPEAPVIDLFISVVIFSGFWLHRKGFRTVARVVVLLFMNIIFAVYACLMPKEVGIYLFYFPLMGISMASFGSAERLWRIFFSLLSCVLLVSLFLSDFDLIGTYQIEAANENIFFLINLVSSATVLLVCINFIMNINEESERRLHILAKEINIKNKDLEKTNAELDRFFYSTSHDLRSPLLSIKGLVNIAKQEAGNSSVGHYLHLMEDRANRLDLFIKDIIDYSRNSRTEVCQEIINMHQLVQEIGQNYQFLEGASQIDFQNEITVIEVLTDRSRVSVILNNLISNAIKYHRLNQPHPWIRVTVNHADDNLNVVVSDNGQGIQTDRQDKIFDMFYRGTEGSQGSGLGLYIVKEMIDKMKGSIRVESREGEGTSFFITLPLAGIEIEETPAITKQSQSVSRQHLIAVA
ncbi:MAG: HAMP domain-containing histidine kinase [Cyclobacteriaceae bacterium]|nr:HAMP domain-containing histidine kinase [Cyclobacteriaceae bacterium]